jgi:hypothetical protein
VTGNAHRQAEEGTMTKTKRLKTWAMTLAGIASLAWTATAGAEGGLTLEERVERLERRGEMPAKEGCCDTSELQKRLDQIEAHIKNLPFGIKLGAASRRSYQYDFNDPTPNIASLRALRPRHNSFVLDLFQLQVSRAPGEDGVGFVTKVNFGKTRRAHGGRLGRRRHDRQRRRGAELGRAPGRLHHLQLPRAPRPPDQGRQVRDPARRRGDRAVGQPEHQPVAGVHVGIPLTHTGATASYAFGRRRA